MAAAIDSAVPKTQQAELNAKKVAGMVEYAAKIQAAISSAAGVGGVGL